MIAKDRVFEQLTSMIASAYQVHYELTKDIPKGDLTPLQFELLELLSVKPPMTLSQISECKGISMPNTSREIRKLTEKGLCEKIMDTEDRRKQYIRLSAGGEERVASVVSHMKTLFFQRTEGISETEMAKIYEAIKLLEATVLRTEM